MAALNETLRPIVRGDTHKVGTLTFTNVPTGIVIDKAWMTVKANTSLSDPGLFQIEITSSATSSGQITDASSSDNQLGMYFVVSGTNSNLATGGMTYLYDIQVRTQGTNNVNTLAMGTVTFYDGVTLAVA